MNKKILFLLLSWSFGVSQTYSLGKAVEIALENKESLKASVMDLQSSKQNVKESYSTILPSVRFSSSMSEFNFLSSWADLIHHLDKLLRIGLVVFRVLHQIYL